MITLEISNQLLEKRLLEKAFSIGKTAQQFVEDMLAENLLRKAENNISYQKLDPKKFIKVINFEIDESEIGKENTQLFKEVNDTQEFAKQLRKKAWTRNY